MFRFHRYYKKPEEKLYFTVDWYLYEDTWWSSINTERNNNRHERFSFRINVMGLILEMEIKRNKVGRLYYGRYIKEKKNER